MAFRGYRLTWEEDAETQPYQEGPFILTFDGRLDNREEIATRACIGSSRFMPDPVLILHAYEKCGDSVFAKLIGEFALTIWNRNTHTLTFVRSVDGARPLYYILEREALTWASSLEVLLRDSTSEPRINESYILEFLISVPRSQHTPFENIGIVPPGTLLRFENDAFGTPKTLWNPPAHDVPPRSDAEYEEEFRETITEAVKVRLRAKGVVFSELSGGLDSSSIVLIANNLLSSSQSAPETLQTVSCI
jgi:asparagine synthase (glutamine-hydrolysing)